jgi:hypothetical protein
MFLAIWWGLALGCLALQIPMLMLWRGRWRTMALWPLVVTIPAVLGLALMTGVIISGLRPGQIAGKLDYAWSTLLFLFLLPALPGALLYHFILLVVRYGSRKTRLWADWEEALSDIKNPGILAFFQQEVLSGQDCNLAKCYLRYEAGPNQQWFLVAHPQNVFALQQSRFQGDLEFWRGGLSQPDEIKTVKDGSCLRFHLSTKQDFEFFRHALELTGVQWIKTILASP